jgi:DNA-binding beta-propeller fold protein YncE
MKSNLLTLLMLLSAGNFAMAQKQVNILQVPGINQYSKIDTAGTSVLPSGRFVTPAGKTIRITHDPFGLSISPDGKKAVTLHNGVVTLIDVATMNATRIPAYGKKKTSPLSNGSFLGVAFSPDSKTLYLSGGDNGAVIVYDAVNFVKTDSLTLNGKVGSKDYDDSFTSDLLFNADKNELLVLDRGNFRMVRIDLTTRKITASIDAGRQPFGLALSPDKKTAFVANVGMYSYPLITGATPKNADSIMISQHPYGDNTKESRGGTVIEGRKIPGVGSPSSPEAMSVFTIDLESNRVIN